MSGIAAVLELDDRPAQPALLGRMLDAVAHRGPDDGGRWVSGCVALGHRMLRTTPESLDEKQPWIDEETGLCLSVDGRVDNREELGRALRQAGLALRTNTDAELFLRSYQRWGEECLGRIVGDFALVIWDPLKRRLFGARDPLGVRPFYYRLEGGRFLCGSELKQMLQDPTLPRRPNQGMMGEYLASQIRSREQTLYQGILRLPPGHLLTVGAGGLRVRRYWDLDPRHEIRYATDAEYAEHFLEVFRESVRCRLRSPGPVGAELSGGLDSSSVVGMAQDLRSRASGEDRPLKIFSSVYPGMACNEREYIQEVLGMWGLPGSQVEPGVPGNDHYSRRVAYYLDFPGYPNTSSLEPMMEAAQEAGCRVLLTGLGGDHCLFGSFHRYEDLLRRVRIAELLRQLRRDRESPFVASPLRLLATHGFWPILPTALRWMVRRVLGREDPRRLFPWIDPEWARSISLVERLREPDPRQHIRDVVKRGQIEGLEEGFDVHCREILERSYAAFQIESRHPLFDRRLVEFALALPEEQRWRGGLQTRFVQRQAMRGLLPESIRSRSTKADFSETFVHGLQALGGQDVFRSMHLSKMGWLDPGEIVAMYERTVRLCEAGDTAFWNPVWPLWMIFGVNLWFNTASTGGEAREAGFSNDSGDSDRVRRPLSGAPKRAFASR